ncbi:MAG: MFS transporter [Acetobacteraceae bacterium]|nr:MFS transporter [Acetobacteraceae bacterium]
MSGLSAGARPSLLAPFANRSFRFMWPADLLTSWAFEMETLILGWYVLVETKSVLMLTLFGAMQFTGTLLAPLFGVAGDRIGLRNLLCLMRGFYAVQASCLTLFAVLGVLSPIHVFAIAFCMGLVRPSDLAIRNTLVGSLMPADQLMAAMGISRTTQDSARIAGAMTGAGLFALLGMAAAYVIVVLFYLVSLMLSLRIARPAREMASAVSPLRDVQEGLAYVWTTPRLLAAMVLAFLVNFCAFPLSGGLLPYVARDIYGMDQSGLGFLAAAFAFGGLVGSITLSTAGRTIPAGRIMICFAFAWYALLLFYAHASYPALGIGLLMLAGFTQSLCMVPMAVMLLRSSGDRFRGRVMGVRMLAVYGMPVGLLLAGVMIREFGFVATATAYCVFGFVASFAIAWHWWAHLWPLEAHANRG